MTMRARALVTSFLSCALLVFVCAVGGAIRASAQASAAAPVPVTDDEGTTIGSITVTEVADPFTSFKPGNEPETGSRYVALTVAVDANAGKRFDFEPSTIVLQDDQGFLWNRTGLSLPNDALVPELSSQTLAPGSRVTGLVGFTLPEGRKPAQVFYQPKGSRLVTLATLIEQKMPAVGERAPIVDSKGNAGTVTVSQVVDPFQDVKPGETPPEGTRFVFVTLTYENTSDGQFFIEPYGLVLRDANGDLWNSTGVSRPDETKIVPDLSNAQLAPGDRVSGAVLFAVPEGTGLAGLYDSPTNGQLLLLADLQAAATMGAAGAATPKAGAAAATAKAGASASTPIASAATGACADLERWLTASQGRIAQAATMSREDAQLTDPASLATHAAAYKTLAQAQLADTPPAGAEAASKALVATFNAYGAAIDQILGATDPGKDTALELANGMNTFNDAGARLQQIEQELTQLGATCGLT
jgi:hypothetical protein